MAVKTTPVLDLIYDKNEIGKLERKAARLTAERNRLKARLEERDREIRSLETRFDRVTNQRDRALSEKYRLQEKLDETRADKSALARKLRRMEKPKMTAEQGAMVAIANGVFPEWAQETSKEIITDKVMSETMLALNERKDEFSTPIEMLLAGIGMNYHARRHFNAMLDAHWDANPKTGEGTSGCEIVIGSGVHAAIYCAIRFQKYGIKPIVIEKEKRAGGVFAASLEPAFFLNSRNRPGPLSVPGDLFGALNVLPGVPIQPSALGGDEYLSNEALAWSVRTALMMFAEVRTGVETIEATGRRLFTANDNDASEPKKVVLATGLATANRFAQSVPSDRYLMYLDFIKRMESPFPLRDMSRVAVLGAGDSGKTVIEALTGQGPSAGLSTRSLDSPQTIDWYGLPAEVRTRAGWTTSVRSRYKKICALLPVVSGGSSRVTPLDKASSVQESYDSLRVDGIPYDYVIDATGFGAGNSIYSDATVTEQSRLATDDGRAIGRRVSTERLLWIGPAAILPVETYEKLGNVAENQNSIFRYADRTALVAMKK